MLNLPKIKVPASELECGMYVHELDRPWLGSPFLFQGFMLDSDDMLQQVQNYTQHVFVDPLRSSHSVQDKLRRYASDLLTSRPDVSNGDQFDPEEGGEFNAAEFTASLRRAKATYDKTRDYIELVLESIEQDDSVNTNVARELVSEMVGNIVKNPSASVWMTYLKERDEYTVIHCVNVCILALTLGRNLGLQKHELMSLGMGALLHDIGKIKVPDHILNKPGRLTPEEFEHIKLHPVDGHKMLSEKDDVDDKSLHIVLHHHERTNGSGYPSGMLGPSIPALTKIVSIVDVYDAITSDRCYHEAITPHEALKSLYAWAEGNFDISMIEAFIRCLGIYPIGSVVELNLGQVGVVISSNAKSRLRPVIMLVLDNAKCPYPTRKLLNLANPRWCSGDQALQIKCILPPGSFDIDVRKIIAEETGGV